MEACKNSRWLAHVRVLLTLVAYNNIEESKYQIGLLMANYIDMYTRS